MAEALAQANDTPSNDDEALVERRKQRAQWCQLLSNYDLKVSKLEAELLEEGTLLNDYSAFAEVLQPLLAKKEKLWEEYHKHEDKSLALGKSEPEFLTKGARIKDPNRRSELASINDMHRFGREQLRDEGRYGSLDRNRKMTNPKVQEQKMGQGRQGIRPDERYEIGLPRVSSVPNTNDRLRQIHATLYPVPKYQGISPTNNNNNKNIPRMQNFGSSGRPGPYPFNTMMASSSTKKVKPPKPSLEDSASSNSTQTAEGGHDYSVDSASFHSCESQPVDNFSFMAGSSLKPPIVPPLPQLGDWPDWDQGKSRKEQMFEMFKAMEIVRGESSQFSNESTKPFEMSDCYKYSTKFRKMLADERRCDKSREQSVLMALGVEKESGKRVQQFQSEDDEGSINEDPPALPSKSNVSSQFSSTRPPTRPVKQDSRIRTRSLLPSDNQAQNWKKVFDLDDSNSYLERGVHPTSSETTRINKGVNNPPQIKRYNGVVDLGTQDNLVPELPPRANRLATECNNNGGDAEGSNEGAWVMDQPTFV